MSAALYFYFWSDWSGAPSPPPAPAPAPPAVPSPTDSGGGGKKKGRGKPKADYVPFDPDFWDAREAYLRTLYPEIPPAPSPDDVSDYERRANAAFEERAKQIEQLNAERAEAITALRFAADIKTMQAHGSRIAEINAKIIELTGKQNIARFMQ